MTALELVDKVNNDPKLLTEFQQGWNYTSIEDYLRDFSYIEDIAIRLACDLGILK